MWYNLQLMVILAVVYHFMNLTNLYIGIVVIESFAVKSSLWIGFLNDMS